jgi:hypothetical protein
MINIALMSHLFYVFNQQANADQSLNVYKQLKDTRKATALSAVKNLREVSLS